MELDEKTGNAQMLKKISAMKARQNFGQIMNEAALRGDDFIIERAGKPMVAIVSMEKYQILQRDREEARQAADQIRNKMKNEDPEKTEKLISEAVKAVRKNV